MAGRFGFPVRKPRASRLQGPERPLKKVAELFRDLASAIGNDRRVLAPMKVTSFCEACSPIIVLINFLGIEFRIAEEDLDSKLRDIAEAARTTPTIPEMIDADIRANNARTVGSHTRNLLRVKRGLEMLRILCQEMLTREGDSMMPPAKAACQQAYGAYLSADVQRILLDALPAIPTRTELYRMMHEDVGSARAQMRIYITASEPVLKYINDLFELKGLGIDW